MDSSLHELWLTAPGSPFVPLVGKDSQFLVGFSLLVISFALIGSFLLSRSLLSVPILGLPASLALAFGVVYMFCAVGVYVMDTSTPLFRALATSTRPIYQLLRCISFANKVHVEISEDGIKFIADHARVMQGMASLGKSLFASFSLNLSRAGGRTGGDDDDDEADDDEPLPATFQVSLPALLEAIQIFGVTDAPAGRPIKAASMAPGSTPGLLSGATATAASATDAFSHQILGMPGTCCLAYAEEGAPFGIVLEEASVRTTCNLATYVPDALEAIPFDRDDLLFKIIMQPRWLLDALVELAPSSPNLLTLAVTPRAPFLRLSSHGPLGSSGVDFSRGRNLFESLWVGERWSQSFKFDLVKSATEAMRIASKVSIRGDRQGVLSLQFMVEMESGSGSMQWLHFTFVPYITDEEDDLEAVEAEGEDDDDELFCRATDNV